MKNEILEKINNKTFVVGIIGLGYVGLPLMRAFHNKGFRVLGLDIDQSKIDAFKTGKSYIKHFGDKEMEKFRDSELCEVTTDFAMTSKADALLMCVPTPLNKYREPDMSYVEETTRSLAPYIRAGQLVILESTTYPGTTEELIKPICEKTSGLKSGKDFFIAYSPEREDPGNPNFDTGTIPKVVGGDGADALEISVAMYSQAIVKVVPVSSTQAAEAVKLLENIFRSVNIALVNELKIVFQEMGIDIFEVINAAKTKPFGFMPFYPGPGLGGHCIPIDPFYLTWKAREFGVNTKFIELAGEINTAMPRFVVRRTMEALNSKKKAMSGSKILCIGLAYKPDIDDMRESPTFAVMDLLEKNGAKVEYYDPFLPVIGATREHAHWTGKNSVQWNKEIVAGFDATIILTNHKCINYEELLDWSDAIVDTRNSTAGLPQKDGQVWKS